MKTEVKKNPGRKQRIEEKEKNAVMRGPRIPGAKVVEDKKTKQNSRARLKEKLHKQTDTE